MLSITGVSRAGCPAKDRQSPRCWSVMIRMKLGLWSPLCIECSSERAPCGTDQATRVPPHLIAREKWPCDANRVTNMTASIARPFVRLDYSTPPHPQQASGVRRS